MNKKLLAVAVSAAIAAPMAASADATIYGSLHVQIVNEDTEVNGSTTRDSWEQSLPDGQLGIKGSEDLGNGLTALYKIEMDIDSYEDASQSRASMTDLDELWIGLTGGFGTVLVGQEDTPYKTFMDSTGVDIAGDSIADVDNMLSEVGAAGFERFTGNGVIAYVSPNFSGFTFAGAVITGGQTGVDTGALANNNDGFAEHYSIGANYKAGGLTVAGGYESKVRLVEAGNTGTPISANEFDQDVWGIGASYKFGAFKVGAKYEDEEGVSGAAGATAFEDDEADRFAISGEYTIGNNKIGVVYTEEDFEADSTGTNSDRESEGWGIVGTHNFSSRTYVYAAYSATEADVQGQSSDDESDKFAVGVVHSF